MNLDDQIDQINDELTTIRDYIRFTFTQFNASSLFYGHGTDNAWDEALQLVLFSLHLPIDMSKDLLDAHLTKSERRHICDLILKRIKERIPVPYLTNQAWFAGMPFYVDQRVIIPRSPIAEFIENHFSPWIDENQPVNRILDLCTGSGCIAIVCALAFPESIVEAVDISEAALNVAEINVKKYALEDQVHLIKSDLFENIGNKYELIISNPPYVSYEEYAMLPKEYFHEPELALATEEQGLKIVTKILAKAGNYLTPNGILIVEVGNSQEALSDRYPEVPFLWLEFERGGQGIFLLTAQQIKEYETLFKEGNIDVR